MTARTEGIDVLAGLDAAIGGMEGPVRERRGHRNSLIHVRAAVAELLAADEEYDAARRAWDYLAPNCPGEIDERSEEAPEYLALTAAKARRKAALVPFKATQT